MILTTKQTPTRTRKVLVVESCRRESSELLMERGERYLLQRSKRVQIPHAIIIIIGYQEYSIEAPSQQVRSKVVWRRHMPKLPLSVPVVDSSSSTINAK